MRTTFVVAVAASLFAGHAFAQATSPATPPSTAAQAPKADTAPAAQNQVPPAAKGPSNPAVRPQEGNIATAPVAGANSFTEGEAKSRIEARGFANVSELRKDDQGIWRGKAMRNGQNVDVALDFQGNVFPRDPS